MTQLDLQRGNELTKKINEITENITLLNYALNKESGNGKIKQFFFSCVEKNKIRIGGDCISFGGHLKVDRECMQLLQDYFENKLAEAKEEFESIGKGDAE